jgi:hypothetical protein
MSFQDFKSIVDVQQRYGIIYSEDEFISPMALTPSSAFLEEFTFSLAHLDVLVSEASRCESIIFPILRDVYKHFADRLAMWSHKAIFFDSILSGVPDYILSIKSALGKTVLERPLLIIVEAKKSDFEQGWGQCLAAMVAAQKLNGNDATLVYGVVTDGQFWQFGRLAQQQFTLNQSAVTTSDLNKLMGMINFLFHHSVGQLVMA